MAAAVPIRPNPTTENWRPLAKRDEKQANPWIVEAHSNLKRGPLNGLFNYTRRPLAAVTLSVVEPVTAEVKTELTEMEIIPGTPARVKAGLRNVPDDARIEVRGLPASIGWREVERTASAVEFVLVPSPEIAGRPLRSPWKSMRTAVGRRRKKCN